MDILCPKCGEPWDHDTLHEVAEDSDKPYDTVAADFRARGCEALGTKHSAGEAHPVISAVYDMLGDDMDGAASMLEDAELFGYLD